MTDECTTVGPKLINPIITLPPGALSTWKPAINSLLYDNFTVGETWNDPSNQFQVDLAEGIAQLDVRDLACPTWGLGKSTSANGTVITTIGPPWLPLIVPPIQMFTLDSMWASICTGILSDQFALTTFALFDPPIALTPAAALVPTPLVSPTPTPVPTPADPITIPDRATPSSNAAKPASLPSDPVAAPAKTEDPGKVIPTQPSVIASADPGLLLDSLAASAKNKGDPPSETPLSSKESSLSAIPGDLPAESITPSSNALDPLSGDSQNWQSNTKIPPSSAFPGDPPVGPIASSSSAVDPPSGKSQKPASDPKVPIPVPIQGGNTQAQTQGLGAIIYNAFGKSGPDDNGAKGAVNTVPLPPQSIFTIGAQTFTANPTGFNIDNTVIFPGDPARTVDGTSISLDKSGVLAIGSSTVSLTNPSTTVLAVAGQTFTPNPSAFSIAGSIVSAGGPAVTIDGTTVSLDQSGALAIGSTTISLTDPSPTPFAPEAFTVAGQTFTPNPSAFSIAGTTVSVDGPAITVSGTVVSLGQSGALRIGSSTISLASPSDPSPSKVYTIAGQTFTPNPSAFPIANTIISAGGPAATIDGTIISLGQSGALAIGSSTVHLPTQSYTPFNKAYTVAGQTFTPNPSAFPIANTIISAGGPAATIDGTIISLGRSGALAIGSSTIISLDPPSDPPPSKIYTVAGQTFTPNPSAFPVAGTTISAGGPAATVNGIILTLQPSGTLLLGSSTIIIPLSSIPPQATFPSSSSSSSSDITIDGFHIEAQSSFVVVVGDGVTLSAGASGVSISGAVVSLESGGETLDVDGTGRFALPTPTPSIKGSDGSESDNVQAFTGGQGRAFSLSSPLLMLLLLCGIWGIVMVLV